MKSVCLSLAASFVLLLLSSFLLLGHTLPQTFASGAAGSSGTGKAGSGLISRRGGNADGTEDWGYVDVRPNAHIFYWLYYTYHPAGYENRPWLLWLQGGPGGSGCGYGNFDIIGPKTIQLEDRNTTWVNQASVLFIDNPVGAGYSYVDDDSAYTTDVQQISEDLLKVMQAILAIHPEFEERPFYIFGQSYGGKMGAHFAHFLHDQILMNNIKIRLMGFAMGNAWISPIDATLTWAPLLYFMSNTDYEGQERIMEEARKSEAAIQAGEWELATYYWATTEGVVIEQTNGVDFYNILKFVDYYSSMKDVHELRLGLKNKIKGDLYDKIFPPSMLADDPLDILMNGPIREILGVIPDNVTWGGQSGDVFDYQVGDFMKPVVDILDIALINTTLQVIIYQGQLDLICDTKGAMDFVQQLKWSHLTDYNSATRHAYLDPRDQQTDMFVKAYERLKFYWILRAGHAVPKDNGDTAYRMLNRILENLDN